MFCCGKENEKRRKRQKKLNRNLNEDNFVPKAHTNNESEKKSKKAEAENNIKFYVRKGSPLYEKIKKLAAKYPLDPAIVDKYNLPHNSKGNIMQFIEGYKDARLLVADEDIMPIGKIDVEKVGNEEQIYIEIPKDKAEEKINITFFHKVDVQNDYGYYWLNHSVIGDSKYERLLEGVSVAELQQAAQAQNANINIHSVPKACKISCRTDPIRKTSIRVVLPDNNYITFYDDGWCKNSKNISINRNVQRTQTNEYTVYNIGRGDDKVEISYRHAGDKKTQKSIRITNKNGDGICIYPDFQVNPVKNGQNKKIENKINCNLFEFIESTFFDVNRTEDRSFLRKPFGDRTHNSFNNMIPRTHLNDTKYSLKEHADFTVSLPSI